MKCDDELTHTQAIARIKAARVNAGRPGYNEYGVPLHACNGFRHDEHHWAYLANKRKDASS